MTAVVGVSMVRNEADIIVGIITHMAAEVDHLVVADNGSTDGTRDLLDDLATRLPLTVISDPEPGYYQSRKMTHLAAGAAAGHDTWIVPFDADEVWYHPAARIRDVLRAHPATVTIDVASLYNHYRTNRDIETHDDPVRRMVWRTPRPSDLPKVAFRWQPGSVIHQGNHGVTTPNQGEVRGTLAIRHFPYRSATQFVAKALQGSAAYAATDLPPDLGAHWRAYGDIFHRGGTEALRNVFDQHFFYRDPADRLLSDPAPYQRW